MDSDIDLKISFRFLELSEGQAFALKNDNLEATFGTHFKTKSITGSVPLREDNIDQVSSFIEENHISKDSTDIFVSFVTEYDTRIFEVPNYVNQAVVKIGSQLVVSYSIV